MLTERLGGLVGHGVLERTVYQVRPVRHEYRLTQKGLDLYPVVLSLVHWGDAHCAGAEGPPVIHRHKVCGHDFHSVLTCSACNGAITARDVEPRLAKSAPAA